MEKPKWMKKNVSPEEFEELEAKRLGGKRHKASGSLWYLKHDGSTKDWLIENKITEVGTKSYSLKGQDLLELLQRAEDLDKSAVFTIYFNEYDIRATIIVERGD